MRNHLPVVASLLVAAAAVIIFPDTSNAQAELLSVEQARDLANRALARQQSGAFDASVVMLESALVRCGEVGCRVVVRTGIGDLHRRQAAKDRVNADRLYIEAVRYYDEALRETPNEPEVIFKKLVAYREMGPHEWQEPFFNEAAQLDPARRALYLSFQGDYYAAQQRWSEALSAYERAVETDPDDDGARSGLIELLRIEGRRGGPELLRRAAEWALLSPEMAASAYGAAVAVAQTPSPPDPTLARRALLGLVSVQARTGRALGRLPPDVPSDWGPVLELRRFLETANPDAAPWWVSDEEGRAALGEAALARGRSALTQGEPQTAERFWQRGLGFTGPRSSVRTDLQRELGMLYSRHPTLDQDGLKFDALEKEIFLDKSGALAAGDLEAAQRYHTALGLVYADRETWEGPYAQNAVDQLSWALATARTRREREGYYQPLPELRSLLARGLESVQEPDLARARKLHVEAAAGYVDIGDSEGAMRSLEAARRLGLEWPEPTPNRIIWDYILLGPTRPDSVPETACPPELPDASAIGAEWAASFGASDFLTRRRFNILADCATRQTDAQFEFALEAFRIVDERGLTLVGAMDVARFHAVMSTVLGSVGLPYYEAHLERAPLTHSQPISVSLTSDTKAFWLTPSTDDMVAGRVIATLGRVIQVSRFRVIDGVVELATPDAVPPDLLDRLHQLQGVRSVRIVPGGI